MAKSKGGILGASPGARMLSIDRRIKPGSDPTRVINELYSYGRTYPREQPPKPPNDPAVNDSIARQGRVDPRKGDRVSNENTNQSPSDLKAATYQNDASGWVRGCKSGSPKMHSESAEHKPGFDKRQSYRRSDKGNGG
jgi:hypothetical protein